MNIVILGGQYIRLRKTKLWFENSDNLVPCPTMWGVSGLNPKDKIWRRSFKRNLTLHPISSLQFLRPYQFQVLSISALPLNNNRWRTAWVTVNFIYKKNSCLILYPEKGTPSSPYQIHSYSVVSRWVFWSSQQS